MITNTLIYNNNGSHEWLTKRVYIIGGKLHMNVHLLYIANIDKFITL